MSEDDEGADRDARRVDTDTRRADTDPRVDDVAIRVAVSGDRVTVRGVLDAALLEPAAVPALLAGGRVLVAERAGGGTVLGTLLAPATVPTADAPDDQTGIDRVTADTDARIEARVDAHIDAVAVRPGSRGRGIGSALVRSAGERWGTLGAAYEPSLRPFYEGLGFAVVATLADGRLYGLRAPG